MDFGVSTATATYLPTQGFAQQALAREGRGAETVGKIETAGGGRRDASAQAESSPASLAAQKAREEAARKNDPSATVSLSPGFSFEYQDNQRVMTVHNAKGVLIYQVPSKGQLALIQAEDKGRNQELRLTA